MSRQPITLFANAAIAAVETIRRDPAIIRKLPHPITRVVGHLMEFRVECNIIRYWNRMKSEFTPLRTIYAARVSNCTVNELAKLLAEDGNLELVETCRKLGANNADEIICAAIKYDRSNVLEHCLKWGESDLSKALSVALECEDFGAFDLVLKAGATNFDDCVYFAIKNGKMNTVDELMTLGYVNRNRVLSIASECDRPSITNLALEHGATNANEAFFTAIENAAFFVIGEVLSNIVDRDSLTIGFRRVLAISLDNSRVPSRDWEDDIEPWIRCAIDFAMIGASDDRELFFTAMALGNENGLIDLCGIVSIEDILACLDRAVSVESLTQWINFVTETIAFIDSNSAFEYESVENKAIIRKRITNLCIDRDLIVEFPSIEFM